LSVECAVSTVIPLPVADVKKVKFTMKGVIRTQGGLEV